LLRPTPIDPEPFVDEVIASKAIPDLDPPSDFTEEMKRGWEEHRRETARVLLLYCTRKVADKLANPETGELPARINVREARGLLNHPHKIVAAIGAKFLSSYTGGHLEVVKPKARGRPSKFFVFMSPDPPSYEELAYLLGPRGGAWEEWRRQVDEYREAVARWEQEKSRELWSEPPALGYAV
jgi:hypothetical protein